MKVNIPTDIPIQRSIDGRPIKRAIPSHGRNRLLPRCKDCSGRLDHLGPYTRCSRCGAFTNTDGTVRPTYNDDPQQRMKRTSLF